MPNVGVTQTIKGRLPRLPFFNVKEKILGKQYDLSIVFIGDQKSKTLNNTYRRKNKSTNILSFPIDEKMGEIFLNLRKSEREAKKSNLKLDEYVFFLLIHGMLHLKGYDHGSTMDRAEKRLCAAFSIPHPLI